MKLIHGRSSAVSVAKNPVDENSFRARTIPRLYRLVICHSWLFFHGVWRSNLISSSTLETIEASVLLPSTDTELSYVKKNTIVNIYFLFKRLQHILPFPCSADISQHKNKNKKETKEKKEKKYKEWKKEDIFRALTSLVKREAGSCLQLSLRTCVS